MILAALTAFISFVALGIAVIGSMIDRQTDERTDDAE
jgi:hypothetical protein